MEFEIRFTDPKTGDLYQYGKNKKILLLNWFFVILL